MKTEQAQNKVDIEHRSQSCDERKKRRIRSFVKRTGRMTKSQELAYRAAMPKYGLDIRQGPIDIESVFLGLPKSAPLNVEIGFGMGDSLALMALAEPQQKFIGIEVHTPGVGRLLHHIEQAGIDNIRVYEADAVEVFNTAFPVASIDRLQIYFPDPWHKKKHHKRRLINATFLDLVYDYLKPNGCIHIATNWQPYAQHVLKIFAQHRGFSNMSSDAKGYIERPDWRPQTKFERRGQRLGHGVYDMLFGKN